MCVNAKMITKTIPGMGGMGVKEKYGEGEYKYDIFDTL
jgi:hypothetical protein